MRLFHYLIDAMAINSFIIHSENVGSEKMRELYGVTRSQRRQFLQKLGIQLVNPEIENRAMRYRLTATYPASASPCRSLSGIAVIQSSVQKSQRK